MFQDKKEAEIKQKIDRAYQEICNELLLDNKEIQKYIEKNLEYIVRMITNAVKQHTLDKIFIVQKFIEN